MTNKLNLSKVIGTVSMCCLSPARMNVRDSQRMELPTRPLTYYMTPLTASARANVNVRMALPIATETAGIVNNVDLKSFSSIKLPDDIFLPHTSITRNVPSNCY